MMIGSARRMPLPSCRQEYKDRPSSQVFTIRTELTSSAVTDRSSTPQTLPSMNQSQLGAAFLTNNVNNEDPLNDLIEESRAMAWLREKWDGMGEGEGAFSPLARYIGIPVTAVSTIFASILTNYAVFQHPHHFTEADSLASDMFSAMGHIPVLALRAIVPLAGAAVVSAVNKFGHEYYTPKLKRFVSVAYIALAPVAFTDFALDLLTILKIH